MTVSCDNTSGPCSCTEMTSVGVRVGKWIRRDSYFAGTRLSSSGVGLAMFLSISLPPFNFNLHRYPDDILIRVFNGVLVAQTVNPGCHPSEPKRVESSSVLLDLFELLFFFFLGLSGPGGGSATARGFGRGFLAAAGAARPVSLRETTTPLSATIEL